MDNNISKINSLLIEVYDDIGLIEERSLKSGAFKDLSITELHTLEAIGLYSSKTMSEIAFALNITTGTLTIAIDKLIKKGYVSRKRSETDRRIVNVTLTKKGKLAYRIHEKFHFEMVRMVLEDLSEEEGAVLIKSLDKLNKHLKNVFSKS